MFGLVGYVVSTPARLQVSKSKMLSLNESHTQGRSAVGDQIRSALVEFDALHICSVEAWFVYRMIGYATGLTVCSY